MRLAVLRDAASDLGHSRPHPPVASSTLDGRLGTAPDDRPRLLLRLHAALQADCHCPACTQVLQDPRQKRFFKARDMSDLFTLGNEYASATETATIFAGLNGEVRALSLRKNAAESKSETYPSLISNQPKTQIALSTSATHKDEQGQTPILSCTVTRQVHVNQLLLNEQCCCSRGITPPANLPGAHLWQQLTRPSHRW